MEKKERKKKKKLNKVTWETTHRKWQGNKVEGKWVTDSVGKATFIDQRFYLTSP